MIQGIQATGQHTKVRQVMNTIVSIVNWFKLILLVVYLSDGCIICYSVFLLGWVHMCVFLTFSSEQQMVHRCCSCWEHAGLGLHLLWRSIPWDLSPVCTVYSESTLWSCHTRGLIILDKAALLPCHICSSSSNGSGCGWSSHCPCKHQTSSSRVCDCSITHSDSHARCCTLGKVSH